MLKKIKIFEIRIFKKNGFALVELLVVVFIISLLASLSFMDFSKIRDELAIKRAAYQMAQDLRGVQGIAMGVLVSEGSINGCGIYLNLNNDNKGYKLYFNRDGNPFYSQGDDVYQNITFEEKSVFIKEFQNLVGETKELSINFQPPHPITQISNLNEEAKEVKIILAIEKNPSKTKTVTVNRAGMIAVK